MAALLGEGVRVGCLGPGFVWTWKDMGFRERSVLGEAGSSDRAPSFVRPLAHLFVQLSTPPASHTRNHPQLPHHQPSAWRACHPRAPARPPAGSFWSHLLCLRAPQSLPFMPLAPLGPLPASLPTPPCPPPGSWCSPAWTRHLKPVLALPPVLGAARGPSQPSPAVVLSPPLSCRLEKRALCLPLEPHPRSSR